MILPILAISAAALGLMQLGALSVWVVVLALSLKVLLLLVLIAALAIGIWIQYRASPTQTDQIDSK